jgi:hypothetical protein
MMLRLMFDNKQAYRGYDGLVPISLFDLSFQSLWHLTGTQIPQEVHIRIQKYSMEEVLQDAKWLDKIWAEKDVALHYFYRHQQFPSSAKSKRRGFCRLRVFDTRWHSLEGSLVSLGRLSIIPMCIPLILLFSIPIAWACLWLWIWYKLVLSHLLPSLWTGGGRARARPANGEARGHGSGGHHGNGGVTNQTGGSSVDDTDAYGDDGNSSDRGGETTPYFPTTPFATPMVPNNTAF